MDINNAILSIQRSIGNIEGEMKEIRKLQTRVAKLEQWMAWVKGGWAALTAAYLYLFKGAYGK